MYTCRKFMSSGQCYEKNVNSQHFYQYMYLLNARDYGTEILVTRLGESWTQHLLYWDSHFFGKN